MSKVNRREFVSAASRIGFATLSLRHPPRGAGQR